MPEEAETLQSTIQLDARSRTARRKKSLACRSCHSRKVKCSGGNPCDACRHANNAQGCVYIARDRQVKVASKYLQAVLAENERLKRGITSASPLLSATSPDERQSSSTPTSTDPIPTSTVDFPADAAVANPLVKERAWFLPDNAQAQQTPIYIGEASCTAFATRTRQSLCIGSPAVVSHFPRVHFARDESLMTTNTFQVSWPTQGQATLLLKVVMARVNRAFHVFLLEPTIARINQMYRDPTYRPQAFMAKVFALFALGEVYSSRAKDSSDGNIPGLSYFKYASSLVQVLPERADLDHVETLLLLSFYSHNLNRRHSAYFWIGSALRLSISLGLHHNLPPSVALQPLMHQHRIRLWWTIYTCDRMWGSKLGHPPTIQDIDVSVDLPSSSDLAESERRQLSDPGYIIANLQLARVVSETISTIYRRKDPPPLIQSVQKILRDLKTWIASLPENVTLSTSGAPLPRYIISLHLSFNQCLILATRPVLLHVLEISRPSIPPDPLGRTTQIPAHVNTIAEACIHAARHSNELLTEAYTEGTLSTLGYFDAQYIFSSAVVLEVASILNSQDIDSTLMQSSAHQLQFMAESGNLAAIEFCGHLDAVKLACEEYRSRVAVTTDTSITVNANEANQEASALGMQFDTFTTERALAQGSMRDFLDEDVFPFDLPDATSLVDGTSSFFYDLPMEL